ncbi:signal recognition particle subunit FFH/SRP54 (srp54) [Acetoanaerobium noterae]|jgi:signal recognition particle subunit SRP54|uniref:Signal recognition particle protein n=2 Tax=root TaxID=1 RepID=A0A1T4ZSN6_9FIRM|nr:signal recognition particle protein [Acetoanaerobium noterae]MBP8763029.1 signal recognition particle protein [Acetoanaerobium sp.]MBP9500089.1 signal recognition particle protein [Acetoanaerobium sp.]MBP9562490.1 signal recognition particle protein [Acetoanaerobium sp.]SKB25343.1 signal recognition particle subunit FFH/SRP54 (srp54) [Acetoanaerobium noterae]
MIFENLAEKLQSTLKNLKGKGKLTEKDVDLAMREVKLALLEADVHYKVVKDFIKKVKERSIGSEVMESLTPGQQVIKIVNEELSELMGGVQSKINISSKPPTVIMLVGLQGAGKTSTAGKLALNLKKQGKQPMLVACDVYRPAAIKQLEIVASGAGAIFYSEEGNTNPVEIATKGYEKAKTLGYDIVIIDTAGRLHIDENLMDELKNIKSSIKPHEIMLVVDSMTGQDAVNIAESFDQTLGIDGVILTKLDGDTRGGAALSIKAITKKPIKYAAVGEKLEDLEQFYPDRMASRILGMGDVMSLIEKAQSAFDEDKAKEMQAKMKSSDFTFDDFLDQMQQIKKMGPLKNLLEMIPGMSQMKQLKDVDIDDKELVKIEAIIQSMTKKERQNPSIINASRKKRIAMGSGTHVSQVNRLLKQFEESKKMMKQFTNMSKSMKKGKMKFPFPGL